MKRNIQDEIVHVTRAYTASLGTKHETHYRQLLEWLVAMARSA